MVSRKSVRRLLWNNTYAGYPHWALRQPEEPSRYYPALWNEATFNAVVLERARRGKRGCIRIGAGPFTGVAVCRRCGRRMSRDAKRGYAYLRCATDVNHGVGGSASCHPNRIAEPLVAAAVSEYLSRVTEEAVRQEWVSGSSAASDLEAGHAKHQKALADLQSRRERLALALDGGNMDVTIYRKVDDTLAAQEKTAETAVWNLQAQMEAAPDIEASVAAILLLRDNFKEMVTRLPPAQVVTLLQSAGLVVEIEEGQVVNVRVTT